jgi:capsular exopolysaccharide synthesis family protein
MGRRSIFAVVAARWPLAVIPVVLAVAVVLIGSSRKESTYAASSTVRVTTRASLLGATVRPDDLAYLDRLFNTYERLATSDKLVGRVYDELQIKGNIDTFVKTRPNTELMDVRVVAGDPQTAVKAANRLAQLFIAEVHALSDRDLKAVDRLFDQRLVPQERQLASLRRQRVKAVAGGAANDDLVLLDTRIRLLENSLVSLRTTFEEGRLAREAQGRTVSLVENANKGTVEAVPSGLRNDLALAIILGGLAGIGLTLLVDRLRSAPHTVDEIEDAFEAPVVGVLPPFRRLAGNAPAALSDPASADAVQRLTALALARITEAGVRTVAVSSAERGEGRTTVATSLAIGLAETGKSVLLVDADLRSPSVHERFGAANGIGLSGLLTQRKAGLELGTVATEIPGLTILPAGSTTVQTAALTGPPLRRIIADAAEDYDVVLLDTSALLGDADALQVVAAVDGVLLVAGDTVGWAALERAVDQLSKIRARLLGVVANGWVESSRRSRYRPDANGKNGAGHHQGEPVAVAAGPQGSRPSRPMPPNGTPTLSAQAAPARARGTGAPESEADDD